MHLGIRASNHLLQRTAYPNLAAPTCRVGSPRRCPMEAGVRRRRESDEGGIRIPHLKNRLNSVKFGQVLDQFRLWWSLDAGKGLITTTSVHFVVKPFLHRFCTIFGLFFWRSIAAQILTNGTADFGAIS